MVRITKISAGIILFILAIILMIQNGFEGFIYALINNGSIGAGAAIVLAITFIIAAIIEILTNRTYSLVPDIVSLIILSLGAVMGYMYSDMPDTAILKVWSSVGIAIGIIVLIVSIVDLIMNPVSDDDLDDHQSTYQNDQYNNFQNRLDPYNRNQDFNYGSQGSYQAPNSTGRTRVQQDGRTQNRSYNIAPKIDPQNGGSQPTGFDRSNNPYANNQTSNESLRNSSKKYSESGICYDPQKSRHSRH